MESRKKRKIWILLSVCVLLIVLSGILGRRFNFIRSPLTEIFSPVTRWMNDVGEWLDKRSHGLDSREELLDQISVLEKRVESLEQENRLLQAQNRRARELEDLYQLSFDLRDHPQTAAEIIGLSPSNWYDYLLIGKGSLDGIEEYMPVMTAGGLLGYVSCVYDSYAEVTTIVSAGSLVFGQINRQGGSLVEVHGQGPSVGMESGSMTILLDGSYSDIAIGDEIVTSSLSDIYPAGLSIGTVVDIRQEASGQWIAYLSPTADLGQVDLVSILTEGSKKTLPFSDREEDTP